MVWEAILRADISTCKVVSKLPVLLLQCNTRKCSSMKEGFIWLPASEDTVHLRQGCHGSTDMEHLATLWSQEAEMDAAAQLVFLFSFAQELQPRGCLPMLRMDGSAHLSSSNLVNPSRTYLGACLFSDSRFCQVHSHC